MKIGIQLRDKISHWFRFYQNFSIRAKILSGYLLVLILMLVQTAQSVINIENVETINQQAISYTKQVSDIWAFRRHMKNLSLNTMDLVYNNQDQMVEEYQATAELRNEYYQRLLEAADTQKEKDLLSKIGTSIQLMDTIFKNQIVPSWQAGDLSKAKNQIVNFRENVAFIEALTDELKDLLTNERDTLVASAQATADNARRLTMILGLLMLAVGIGAGLFIASLISKPIKNIQLAAERLSVGDVYQEFQVDSRDEIGSMADAFKKTIEYLREMAYVAEQIADGNLKNDVVPKSDQDQLSIAFVMMTIRLRDVIGLVKENTNSLNLASAQLAAAANQASDAVSQIAATIQQVAKGTGQQSEAASETAASMEQMRRSIDGVARGAQEQAEAVSRAAEITSRLSKSLDLLAQSAQNGADGGAATVSASQNGARVVENTVQAMNTIRSTVGQSAEKVREMGERSKQIGVIVETIDDIASQTNLLALNAAIEAARAGEHGKGFAVVADEVRKLAERSSAATKEITGLIKTIQSTVVEAVNAMDRGIVEIENGVQTANQAGSALQSIMETAAVVEKGGSEAVMVAKQAQTESSELVSAMDTVSAVVEENTAATEEMAAGSNEVSQAVENIASVSEENSASVEEVSASTEEMSAQVEEVTASAHSLAEMSTELQSLVDQFTLE